MAKGVSLGIYKQGDELGMEATKGGSQSYVELMGRRSVFAPVTQSNLLTSS